MRFQDCGTEGNSLQSTSFVHRTGNPFDVFRERPEMMTTNKALFDPSLSPLLTLRSLTVLGLVNRWLTPRPPRYANTVSERSFAVSDTPTRMPL